MKIHFNDGIEAQDRPLHLQTQFFEEQFKMVSTLFENGSVLHKEEKELDNTAEENKIKVEVEAFHWTHYHEISRLFAFHDRVLQSHHAMSLFRLGRQFLKWGMLKECIAVLKSALKNNEQLGHAYCTLIDAFLLSENVDDAARYSEKSLVHCSEYADLYFQSGKVYLYQKKYISTIQAFLKALKINPKYHLVHIALAACFMKIYFEPTSDAGLPTREECLKRLHDHFQRGYSMFGEYRSHELDQIAATLEQESIESAYQKTWHFLMFWRDLPDLSFVDDFYLNFMYGESGRDPGFLEVYIQKLAQIARENPQYADVQVHLGIARLILCRDNFNEALHCFKKAQTIHPGYQNAVDHLMTTEKEGHSLLKLLREFLQ